MSLDDLFAHAEGYANFAMRKNGNVPPTLFAATPTGVICYVPHDLADVRAKDSFANTSRLICAAYSATAVVMLVEGWVTMAKPGEPLDDTPPSEAFDRREVVALTGETGQHCKQMLLPIIRTYAGGFFGFGVHVGPKLDNFEGRFAQRLPPKRPGAGGIGLTRAMMEAMGVTEERLRGDAGQN